MSVQSLVRNAMLRRGWSAAGARFIVDRAFDADPAFAVVLIDRMLLRPERERCKTNKKVMSFALRMKVFERDDFTCRRCGVRKDLQADHVIPESAGGATTLGNLQTLCGGCNRRKGARQA